jgi:sugar O-acyltransferase (sialic acid O-acetyltransferase NeuD family)
MKFLALYGAGGFGREALDIAQRINVKHAKWDKIFFVDDFKFGNIITNTEVLTFDDMLKLASKMGKSLNLVITNGDSIERQLLLEKVIANNLDTNLIPLISSEARVASSAKIEAGSIVCPGAQISVDVKISLNCVINCNSIVGHDVTIEKNSVISSQVTLGGNVKVLEGVFIGMGTIVREGITIGAGSIVGMGSAVYQNVPSGLLVVGNPARAVRRAEQVTLYNNKS